MKKLLLAILILSSTTSFAAHNHPEKYYQVKWCNEHHGVIEHRLGDQTRVDCLTDTHAIEFDFAHKWAESEGQALHYASKTGKRAGIVLILENDGDDRYVEIVAGDIARFHLPIDLWTMVGEK